MRRIDPCWHFERLLPSALLLATLAGAPPAMRAQQAAISAASATPPLPSLAELRAHVTPEDRGDSLLFHRRYEEAIVQYKKASADSPDVWDKLGIAYQMLSDFNHAERCYKRSLHLKADNELALNNLATVYELQGHFRKAEALYRKALQLDPDYAQFAMNLGTNLMIQAKYTEGSSMYRRALALDPHVFDHSESPALENAVPLEQRGAINYYMARNCAQAGMNDRAVSYLKKALDEGYITAGKIARDACFAGLRNNPAFQRLISEN